MASFDQVAHVYDEEFSHTEIGKKQRNQVWDYLEQNGKGRWNNIMELNCGTGEDAMYLSKNCDKYLATDSSIEMLSVAKAKNIQEAEIRGLQFLQLDILDFNSYPPLDSVDLVFSNFGGFNCLNKAEIQGFSNFVYENSKAGLDLILVVMPKDTILDLWFNIYKLKFTKFLSRKNGQSNVKIGQDYIDCYYYNKEELCSLFSKFRIVNCTSIGFIPSYLNRFMSRHSMQSKYLSKLESKWMKKEPMTNKADHYLIHFRKDT